jgi:hypothetical protein
MYGKLQVEITGEDSTQFSAALREVADLVAMGDTDETIEDENGTTARFELLQAS